MMNPPSKILIRSVNWIGDAVLTLPAIKSLRHAYPESHISILARPWVSDIFRENHAINEIILYRDEHKGIAGKLRLTGELKKKNFDLAILFQNAFDAALITWLARIPERVGYARDMRKPLLTIPIKLDNEILKMHQVYYYLNIIKSLGIDPLEAQPYLRISDSERKNAKKLIERIESDNFLIIGINPGATYGSAKRWPPERFADLIKRISSDLNAGIIIFGSKSEERMVQEILSMTGPEIRRTNILNMAGKTTLRELIALISLCDVFITNDTGPMHIASALFVPVVALFGSTDSTKTGPLGIGHEVISKHLRCSPCMERECPEGHLRCMYEISVDEVFEALKRAIPSQRAVFLDRDGTIIEDAHYLNNFDDLVIFPESKVCMDMLRDRGFLLIGITNQSGIARGIVEEEFVIDVHKYLMNTLGIDEFYYCPHHPDDKCDCRKPEPLMILKARLRHKINLRKSYMIGDMESDILMAKKMGITAILLSPDKKYHDSADHVAANLKEAVEWIINRENKGI